MKPRIILFYHCLIYKGDPPQLLHTPVGIIQEFACYLRDSGLGDAASEIIIGVNGGEESVPVVKATMPDKARLVLHGLNSFSENLTLVEIEKWVKSNTEPAYIFYGHVKGSSHISGPYAEMVGRWRRCMLKHLVCEWRQCVDDLAAGSEAVGCHWLTGQGWDKSQHYFAGNYYWSTSDFLATLPSIYERERIKVSGIASAESRYEAEVKIGNGPRLPRIKDYATDHPLMGCP